MSEPVSDLIRVLLVEDDEDDYIITRDLIEEIRTPRIDLAWCRRSDEGLAFLAEERCDLCLVDYQLGGDDGIAFVEAARRQSPDTPTVMLTGADDRSVDLAAMRAGAADFVSKQHLTASLLERVVRYTLERSREVKARRETDAKLAQAQRLESLAVVAGGVAHELNNVLGVIMADGDWAIREMRSERSELRSAIETMLAAAHQGAAVVTKLLQYAGRERLTFEAIDLGAVLQASSSIYRRLVGEGIDLSIEVQPDLPSVLADRSAVDGIVWSLISNGRDALNHDGFIRISVDHDRGEECVRLTVEDDGTGMTAEVLDRALEPFFTTKGPASAAGMGLAMVHGLVDQHRGRIDLFSERGRGTVVSVWFPVADATARTPVSSNQPDHTTTTLLLVEDEDALRRTARRFLEREGFRVLEGRDGEEGLEVVLRHEGRIDLIVTDVLMPRMSGVDLYNRVLEIADPPPVLFISGYTATELGGPILDAGLPLLMKPWTLDELADAVRGMLRGREGRVAG